MVSRPVRDHFGLENGLEIWSRHSVNTMQYHAIPCIINNCWRSVPLPCGRYMAIFKIDSRRYLSRDLFKLFPGQLVSWTWRTSPWTSRDAHWGSDHVRSIKSKIARHLKTNYDYVYRWFLQLGTQMMMWPTSGQPEGSRPSGKIMMMMIILYLTTLFPPDIFIVNLNQF